MNAAEQRARCPVKIGQTYKGGKVIYILGDKNGWDVNTKHEQIGTTDGLVPMPIHREEWHRIDN
jgi:hypothetical protein